MKSKILKGVLILLVFAVPSFKDKAPKVPEENKVYTVWCSVSGIQGFPLEVRAYKERDDGWEGLISQGGASIPVKARFRARGDWGCLIIREDHLGD